MSHPLTTCISEIGFLQERIREKSARIEALEAALEQSVRLQSHYAELLNMHDGGQRIKFANAQAWIDRLAALAPETEK